MTPAHRLASVLVGAALATQPLIHPGGPGNTAAVDLFLVVAVLAVLLWASADHAALHAPYIVPFAVIASAGLLSSLLGQFPGTGLVTIVQDAWLFLTCIAIANVGRTPESLRIVMRSWAISAVFWSALLLVAQFGGIGALAGHTFNSSRAALTFEHPNQAGSYFLLSFWVVMATPFSTRARKFIACALVLGAQLVTGSMGAAVGLAAGAGVVLAIGVARRSGWVAAIAIATIFSLGAVGLIAVARSAAVLKEAEQSDVTAIHDTIGRGDRSSSGRITRFAEIWQFRHEIGWLGVGAAGTKDFLLENQATQAKEAHNDYVATLTERGLIGGVGLVLLIGAATARAVALVRGRVRRGFNIAVASTLAMVGGAVSLAANGLTHEVLHYRQSWAFLGVFAAVYLFAAERPEQVRT
jgi:O-antigen ligase